MSLPILSVYTDGSSNGSSNGPSGWGWIIINLQTLEVLNEGSEGSPQGTNNTAELQGAIKGLEAAIHLNLHKEYQIELVSDSTYVLNLATGLFTPHTNKELALQLKTIFSQINAQARWVKGHNSDPVNIQVDLLAKKGKALYSPPKTPKKPRNTERKRKRLLAKAYKALK